MAKLSIVAAPTFKAPVAIPVAGSEPVNVIFTFKHRTFDQLKKFAAEREGKTDAESLVEFVADWDFAEPLTIESATTMLQNYLGAAVPIYTKYLQELSQAKAKN
jgi:hypothetical protein